jgi:hypothetical protein
MVAGPRSRTVSRSFRLENGLVENLQRRARARGESANALAGRSIDEGLRQEEHPLITFRDGAAGRRAAIAGTRLDVWQVIDTLRASSSSGRGSGRLSGRAGDAGPGGVALSRCLARRSRGLRRAREDRGRA